MISWKDEYALGIAVIDEQHKRLLDIANRAYRLLSDEFRLDKYDEILEIIEELKSYTVYHFQAEEEYMASIRYGGLLSHKVEHSDFVDKLNEVDLTTMDSDQDGYLMGILDFVSQWIVNHILKRDRQYVQA